MYSDNLPQILVVKINSSHVSKVPWGLRRTGAHLTHMSPPPNISHQPQGEKCSQSFLPHTHPGEGWLSTAADGDLHVCWKLHRTHLSRDGICLLCHLARLPAVLPPVMNGSLEGWRKVCKASIHQWGLEVRHNTKCPSTRWPSADVLKKAFGFSCLYLTELALLVFIRGTNSFLSFWLMSVFLCNSEKWKEVSSRKKNNLQGICSFLL